MHSTDRTAGTSNRMKAIRLHSHGSPDVLVYEDVPFPQPGPDQVLIRVEAAAVNYADLMRRRNDPYPFPTALPFTPGAKWPGPLWHWATASTNQELVRPCSPWWATTAQMGTRNTQWPTPAKSFRSRRD